MKYKFFDDFFFKDKLFKIKIIKKIQHVSTQSRQEKSMMGNFLLVSRVKKLKLTIINKNGSTIFSTQRDNANTDPLEHEWTGLDWTEQGATEKILPFMSCTPFTRLSS